MSKLWNGKKRKVIIYSNGTGAQRETLIADDARSVSPFNVFYLDDKEVGRYDERQCFYKSVELEAEEMQR